MHVRMSSLYCAAVVDSYPAGARSQFLLGCWRFRMSAPLSAWAGDKGKAENKERKTMRMKKQT